MVLRRYSAAVFSRGIELTCRRLISLDEFHSENRTRSSPIFFELKPYVSCRKNVTEIIQILEIGPFWRCRRTLKIFTENLWSSLKLFRPLRLLSPLTASRQAPLGYLGCK